MEYWKTFLNRMELRRGQEEGSLGMDYGFGAVMIVVMCVVILCVISLRRHAEFLLNFLLRGITGALSIVLVNEILAAQNFAAMVGINLWTVLTSAILGLPGVLLLYGIHIFKFL